MALTSYGADNLVIEQDYSKRFNEILVGKPEVTVELSAGTPVVAYTTWWEGFQEETARWRWVGMDYSTAQGCADTIRSQLTFSKYAWDFGTYISNDTWLYGYHKAALAPELESDVAVVKNGNGAMYDVVVDACATDEVYAKMPNVGMTASSPLRNILNQVDGWNNYPSRWSVGHSFGAASFQNLVLVSAPTRKRRFELVGQDIIPVLSSLSVVFPDWYKCVDEYSAQIRYEGMTLSACRALYTSINMNAGALWLSSHPFVYKYDTTTHEFKWMQDMNSVQWQNMSEFRALKGDGNMWYVEIDLHAEDVNYTKNPNNVSWSYPSKWSSIPGLSAYL